MSLFFATLFSKPSWLRLALLLPLLWSLHAESALAATAVPAEAELALCEFADISLADGPGACGAPQGTEAAATPDPELDREPSDAAARAAPMCDNAAASIAAVPEVPELDRGRFEPARCDVQRLLALLRSDDRARSANVSAGGDRERPEPQPVSVQHERFDAARPAGPRWPLPAEFSIVALGAPRGLARQPGHRARIDRPPSRL